MILRYHSWSHLNLEMFQRREENRSKQRKTSQSKVENQHVNASTPVFETNRHWWEASALSTAAPLHLALKCTDSRTTILNNIGHLSLGSICDIEHFVCTSTESK